MASTSLTKSFHVRSISFPSNSHPNLVHLQDCLRMANTWVDSPSRKAQLTSGIGILKELYSSINAFLQLPLIQQALFGKQRMVRELMDDFLCMLDVCGMVKDSLSHMRERYQSIGSAMRRDESGLESEISVYHCIRKKIKKEMSKCLRLLKSMEKHVVFPNGGSMDTVDQVFNDVRATALLIFRHFCAILSCHKAEKSIFSRLGLAGSKIHEKKDDQKDMSAIEKADMAISSLCNNSSKINAESQMEVSDLTLSETEAQLEDFYRCLIETKVSLLNIVTGC